MLGGALIEDIPDALVEEMKAAHPSMRQLMGAAERRLLQDIAASANATGESHHKDTCILTNTHTSTCTHTHTHTNTHTNSLTHTQTHTRTHTHTHTHTHIHARTTMYMYIYIYLYTHILAINSG